jgi:N-acetylmuramoyl-L-alanine amidase
MHWIRSTALLCTLTAGLVKAQSTPAFNRQMIVLDPAHGGQDGGARIDDHLEEKDVTLALAGRLRSLLAARGFTVVSTRQGDLESHPGGALTTDQRAEAANRVHAVACLVIHASASGNGVYLGTSTIGSPLAAVPQNAPVTRVSNGAVPWDRAQESYISQSLGLANQVGTALARSKLPLAMARVAMRPLDDLMCPAISIEIATLHNGSDATPVSDEEYQQRVAEAIAGALVLWKNQAVQPESVTLPETGSRPGGGA